jgi:CheY-like chemotaxis protein
MRVLICATNRDHLVTLGILFRSEGYIVQLAKDAAEGLKLAETYLPDVAFLDLETSDRSGFELAEELHRRYGKDCPFLIAMASNGESNQLELAEISGFHHFVAKPYAPQDLLGVLVSLDR